MLGIVTGFLGSLFSSSKATDTVVDAVRKIGGLDDMNGQQKAQFLIDYAEATKHQSPARRFIATLTVAVWTLFVVTWLIARWFGYTEFCDDILLFMEEIILQPHSIIVGAYFVIHAFQGKK